MRLRGVLFNNGMVLIPKLNCFTYNKDYKDIDFNGKHFLPVFTSYVMDEENLKKMSDAIISRRYESINLFGDLLAIVPTTRCDGRCTYCYASPTREHDSGYIDKETLLKSMDKIFNKNGNKKITEVIVYGGDPVVDVAGLDEMLSCFDDTTNICLVTGLLYSEETFVGLMDIFLKYNNISLCLSIDPPAEDGKYNRVFNFDLGSTYENLLYRAAQLILLDNNRVAVRQTVTGNAYKFDKLHSDIQSELLNLTGGNIDNLQFQMTVEMIDHEELSREALDYIEQKTFEFYDKGIQFSPAKRFTYDVINNPDYLLNLFGDCDQMFGRVTVGPFGEFHGCPNSPVQQNQYRIDPSNDYVNVNNDLLTHKRTTLWDKCLTCDFVIYCAGFCYIVSPTDSRCEWRSFNICEGIYQSIKDFTEVQILTCLQNSRKEMKKIGFNLNKTGE